MIDPPLRHLLAVTIDPNYTYTNLWDRYGIGRTVAATYADIFEDGLTETAAVAYSNEQILGRHETIKSWTGVQSREVAITFRFRVQGQPGNIPGDRIGGSIAASVRDTLGVLAGNQALNPGATSSPTGPNTAQYIRNEVIRPAKFLEALKYALIGDNGIAHAPPPVILTIGSLLAMRCVVDDCSINWVTPWDPETMLPYGADVQVRFASVSRLVGAFNPSSTSASRFSNASAVSAFSDRQGIANASSNPKAS